MAVVSIFVIYFLTIRHSLHALSPNNGIQFYSLFEGPITLLMATVLSYILGNFWSQLTGDSQLTLKSLLTVNWQRGSVAKARDIHYICIHAMFFSAMTSAEPAGSLQCCKKLVGSREGGGGRGGGWEQGWGDLLSRRDQNKTVMKNRIRPLPLLIWSSVFKVNGFISMFFLLFSKRVTTLCLSVCCKTKPFKMKPILKENSFLSLQQTQLVGCGDV